MSLLLMSLSSTKWIRSLLWCSLLVSSVWRTEGFFVAKTNTKGIANKLSVHAVIGTSALPRAAFLFEAKAKAKTRTPTQTQTRTRTKTKSIITRTAKREDDDENAVGDDKEESDKDALVTDEEGIPTENRSTNDDSSPGSPELRPLNTATVLLATGAFVSFWPLLALLRSTTSGSPIEGFDVDTFMALKSMLDVEQGPSGYGDTILELPPLSPAEQLVGAIFGPPPSH